MKERFINWLYERFKPVLEHEKFDETTGTLSLANFLSIAPQLWSVIQADNVEAVSVLMWIAFAGLQTVFGLVGLKAKNLGMVISMVISIVISLSIVGIVLVKQ